MEDLPCGHRLVSLVIPLLVLVVKMSVMVSPSVGLLWVVGGGLRWADGKKQRQGCRPRVEGVRHASAALYSYQGLQSVISSSSSWSSAGSGFWGRGGYGVVGELGRQVGPWSSHCYPSVLLSPSGVPGLFYCTRKAFTVGTRKAGTTVTVAASWSVPKKG